MNYILRIARLRIALQRAFLGRAILRVIKSVAFVIQRESNQTLPPLWVEGVSDFAPGGE